MTRDELVEEHGADLLFLSEDFFDAAIVGVTQSSQVVYDMDLMVDLFATNNDCTEGGGYGVSRFQYMVCLRGRPDTRLYYKVG